MTPSGQIIADNGTIISVPNLSRPTPSPIAMHLPGSAAMKSGPLHAMQNMRSALGVDSGMPHQPVPASAPPPSKKKRPPQGDKKKKAKVGIGNLGHLNLGLLLHTNLHIFYRLFVSQRGCHKS